MSSHYEIIGEIIGSKILNLQYLVHFFDDTPANVIAVGIEFADHPPITIQCDSDGESIKIDDELPKAVEIGEYGRTELVAISKFDPASLRNCVGGVIKDATIEINSKMPKSLLINCGSGALFVSNVGDTLNFNEARYRRMVTEENWEIPTAVYYSVPDSSAGVR